MDKKPNTIAFIESNTTGSGEKFIETALNKNYQVVFLTANPAKYSFIRKFFIHPIEIDTTNLEILYEYLKNIPNLKAIISTSESFIYHASFVAQQLSLPAAKPDAIENCRNKFLLGTLLAKANLPAIATKRINAVADVVPAVQDLTFPVIVKPNYGTGSIGVKLCDSPEAVIEHCQKLNNTVLVQEYILGEEYSAEILAFNNSYHLLGITKKYLGNAPYFVEVAHEFPAPIDLQLQDEVFQTMVNALKVVDFIFGPVHIEFRIFNQKIYIIEINPRLAGGMIPALIEQSQQIKLIENLLNLYTGNATDFAPKASFITKIAFILPQAEGELIAARGLEVVKKINGIVDCCVYKNKGEVITLKGDFSDRVGYIIAKSSNLEECRKTIQSALSQLYLDILPVAEKNERSLNHARNRLAAPLNSKVKKILSTSLFDELSDLKFLSVINKAHILMLQKCTIISTAQAVTMLKGVLSLEANAFAKVMQLNDAGVGYYLAYEQALIDEIGINIAGNIHLGRSRNDINATIQRFKSRTVFEIFYSTLWQLRSEILQVAARSTEIAMPIYSQYQPAMPATYAYYLLAIENTLALHQEQLKQVVAIMNSPTLGASAGAGTTFSIDPSITAKLLGFDGQLFNALTVVATRDLELMLLSSGAILGTTVSRIAQDYQLWTTLEFALMDLPDSLCGISSVMPQKKNPYLLEKIKGKAISISGTLNSALAVISKTPFANSVEVGTEAFTNYISSFDELIKAMQLLEIIIQAAKPVLENMQRSNIKGLTVATAVAEMLAKNDPNISYREAHATVGQTIMDALDKKQEPLTAILKLVEGIPADVDQWSLLFEHGGGPGKESTTCMLNTAKVKLCQDADFLRNEKNKWQQASELLAAEVQNLQKIE